MSVEEISVLLVEDNPGDARLLYEAVKEAEDIKITLSHETTLTRGLQRVASERFDVVMLDLSLPDAEGLETLVRMHAQTPLVPIVVLTGLNDEALAVRAVREGAQDYLVKGQVTGQVLVRAMRYATERKRAVEALQQSEEYYRSLIENALDIITVLDMDGVVTYGSPSIKRVLGYQPAELIGQKLLHLIHPDDCESVRTKLFYRSSNESVAGSFEFQFLHKNGNWCVLEAMGKKLEPNGMVAGYVLNSREVTERKRSEAMLREAIGTLEAVIETSPLAIYSLDLAALVTNWNSAAERVLGYSAAEVLGRPLPAIFGAEPQLALLKHSRSGPGRTLPAYEGPCSRKDGTPVEVSVWVTDLLDVSGAVMGQVAMVTDNTERKRLEEQFRQSSRMEAVGRLAGGVAHDFNNLLTVITGYCQMLLDRLDPQESLAEDMNQVLRAADRATTLTKQLLAFSRQQIVQPKVVDLHALISDMDHILNRLVGEDIELRIEGRPGVARVRVDPGQIEQVVVNMAVNARDAMPHGGRLLISTSTMFFRDGQEVPHTNLSPGPHVLLQVTDTGSGMDPHTKDHLFEPFFTTKEKGKGTGLGLSTSYGIVKQNQGEILVQSELGKGSTFEIYLPKVQDSVQEDARPQLNRMARRGTETILVVEDEEGVRRVLIEMLQQQGYHVLMAPSGHEALELCETAEGIQLLITDVVMPKMSGRELSDRLRLTWPLLKVLFVSGYTDSAIVHHGVLDEGTHFLQKPFTPESLAEKVREVLEA